MIKYWLVLNKADTSVTQLINWFMDCRWRLIIALSNMKSQFKEVGFKSRRSQKVDVLPYKNSWATKWEKKKKRWSNFCAFLWLSIECPGVLIKFRCTPAYSGGASAAPVPENAVTQLQKVAAPSHPMHPLHVHLLWCAHVAQKMCGCGSGSDANADGEQDGDADAGAGPQTALLLRVPYFILIYSVVHTYFRYGLPPQRIHAFPFGWLASFASNYRKGNCSWPNHLSHHLGTVVLAARKNHFVIELVE